jgi:hypothetical protein
VSIVWRVLFLEHQPSFQHRQLVPWSIFRYRISPVCAGYILCLRSLHSSSSCLHWNSPFLSLYTKSSEPNRLRSFWYPYPLQYPILVSGLRCRIPWFDIAVFASCDCVKSLLTRVLPRIGFTFNKPDFFCTLLYCTTYCTARSNTVLRVCPLYKSNRCVSWLRKSPSYRYFCRIQDSSLPRLNISLIYYIASVSPDTVFACLSRYSFCMSQLRKLTFNTHFAVYRIHFQHARILYCASVKLIQAIYLYIYNQLYQPDII